MWTNEGDAIYLNADKTEVVEEGSEEAAYLLVASGGQIPIEVAEQYGLTESATAPEAGKRFLSRRRQARKEEEESKARLAPDNKLKQPEPDNKRRG